METVSLPPVYRPRPYQKPTAPLVKRHNTSMPDGASIASFIYSGSEKGEKNLFSHTPILMLHGNGEEHGIFGRVIDAMVDRGYDVIAIDSRDQGESTRGSAEFTYERMTADAAAVLDDLGIIGAHVLGFSDGGIEGLLLARDYANKVASLTAIGANLIPEGAGDISWIPEYVAAQRHWARCGYEGATLEDGYPVPSPHEAAKIAEHIELMYTEPQIPAESLSSIKCPTTIMAGEYDDILASETLRIAQAIPHAHLLFVPGMPHNLPKANAESVVRVLLSTIKRKKNFA